MRIEELVNKNVKAGRLYFTIDTASAIRSSDIIFIAVGTPSLKDGNSDLSYVKSDKKLFKRINCLIDLFYELIPSILLLISLKDSFL